MVGDASIFKTGYWSLMNQSDSKRLYSIAAKDINTMGNKIYSDSKATYRAEDGHGFDRKGDQKHVSQRVGV